MFYNVQSCFRIKSHWQRLYCSIPLPSFFKASHTPTRSPRSPALYLVAKSSSGEFTITGWVWVRPAHPGPQSPLWREPHSSRAGASNLLLLGIHSGNTRSGRPRSISRSRLCKLRKNRDLSTSSRVAAPSARKPIQPRLRFPLSAGWCRGPTRPRMGSQGNACPATAPPATARAYAPPVAPKWALPGVHTPARKLRGRRSGG